MDQLTNIISTTTTKDLPLSSALAPSCPCVVDITFYDWPKKFQVRQQIVWHDRAWPDELLRGVRWLELPWHTPHHGAPRRQGKIVVPCFLPSPPLLLPPPPTKFGDRRQKVLGHFWRSVLRQTPDHAHSRYMLSSACPPLLLERVDTVGPFSLMENNIGAGGVQCWADVRSFPRMFRLCENSSVQHCSGSSTIFRRRTIAFVLPSHFPRIRYIYRAAKTSEKLPNTWENNEPVLCDCECLSSSPL